jgi:hypothetical protein
MICLFLQYTLNTQPFFLCNQSLFCAGVEQHNRTDHSLYADYESEKDKQKRQEKEKKQQEKSGGENSKKGSSTSSTPKKREDMFYRVTVKDNGCGMSHDDIPNMLGRVLCGTKYQVQMESYFKKTKTKKHIQTLQTLAGVEFGFLNFSGKANAW